jgi:uncharacterized protein
LDISAPFCGGSRHGGMQLTRPRVVQVLLANGANVNSRASNGRTTLVLASQYAHKEVVQALLAKGADVNSTTTDGFTALVAARATGHSEVIVLLEQAGLQLPAAAVVDNPIVDFIISAGRGDAAAVRAFLDQGGDVNSKNKTGGTALFIAL